MRIKSRRSVLFGAFALIAIIVLWLAPKANAATVTINKAAGTPIALPVYAANDTLEITGDALDAADWTVLRTTTTLDFHLFLNNPAMTTIDTNPAAVSIMMGNIHILSLKAPHILSIANGGLVGFFYFGAFKKCERLESIDLPAITEIGSYAFQDCYSLNIATIPNVININNYAFHLCKKLVNISAPHAANIGNNVFQACESLESVDFPKVTVLGSSAFASCKKLKSVNLPNVTKIENGTFYECETLESISLPAATTIGLAAFYYCTALESVSLPAATTIGLETFENCIALKNISLPVATTIGLAAFYDCRALESVSLPAATTIGAQAFNGCTALTEYVFGTNPPTKLGNNIGFGSYATPTYYHDGNVGAWFGFTLDAINHAAATAPDYSGTTYSLAPIAPATATIVMGNSQTFTTTLSASNVPPTIYQNWITWQLTGTNPVRSTIDALGKVTIDPDETNAMIIVTAKVVVGTKTETKTTLIHIISTKCNITSFAFPNQVGASVINNAAGTIAVTMPHGTNVTALSPTIAVSNFAMIAPLSGAAQDFTNPVNYIVTAQDGVTTGTYAVTVTLGTAPAITPPPTTTTTSTTPANYVYNFAQLPTVENNYTAIVNIDFSQFTGVYVDGSLLSSDKYTAQSGSTIVRLNESFINTLSTGEHTIGLSFSDGLASGSFDVRRSGGGIFGIGVYPFEGGMQPYTPSVTPSIRAIEEEKLDEGVLEQEIFDEAETSQSPTLMLVISGAIVALGAGILINRRRKSVS